MKSSGDKKKIQHLFSRAAFGISVNELNDRKRKELHTQVDELFKESEIYTPLAFIDSKNMETMQPGDRKNLSEEERKKRNQERRHRMDELNLAWLQRLWTDPARLRERMTFFWHGHFACRIEAPWAMQDLNNIHRKYALGSFRDMLFAVSKSPAMLQFLNNQQNRKMHPNENFAREVMELFTLGRGNYTEDDIKEAARAFTGWGFDPANGSFVFKEQTHDTGDKTLFGKTGPFNGDDVLNALLERKETAYYICKKIYRFFVNDEADEKKVRELASVFYDSKYDTGILMKHLFNAEWFYESRHIGAKIKSPIDLLAGIHRLIPVHYENTEGLLVLQRALGQALFYPPNVSGWAGGRGWIDSSSLMFRLKTPSLLLNNGIIEMEPKDELLDEKSRMMMIQQRQKREQQQLKGPVLSKLKPTPDWNALLNAVGTDKTRDELIADVLVPAAPSQALLNSLPALTATNHKEFILELLSAPEYQMA
ncbi:MAG: DUF1800 family protein [Bacteroidia bacterium]